MPEIVYYVAASVDGRIATSDGGIGWLSPFETAGEDYGYAEFFAGIDAVILGSRTYELSLTFGDWPYPGKPVWAFTGRDLGQVPEGVTLESCGPRELAAQLDASGIHRAWLVGGGALAASFQEAGLITEYIISIIPVVLGAGIQVLGGRGIPEGLRLEGVAPYPNGVVQLRYRRAEGERT